MTMQLIPTSIKTSLVVLGIGLISSVAMAQDLKPFDARYSIDWQGKVNFSGDAIRKLSKQQDQWLLESNASSFFASLKESSRFNYGNQIQPINYSFKRKVLGRTRKADLDFDWQQNKVTNDVNDQPWKMDIHPGVLDKLNVQLQLRLDLADGKTEFNYPVADGGHLKTYSFAIDGKERLKTEHGEYDTIRVKRVRAADSQRKTLIWFAPQLDYLMVQIHQVEKDDKSYSLQLKSFTQY